jgi:hypothetical protein
MSDSSSCSSQIYFSSTSIQREFEKFGVGESDPVPNLELPSLAFGERSRSGIEQLSALIELPVILRENGIQNHHQTTIIEQR